MIINILFLHNKYSNFHNYLIFNLRSCLALLMLLSRFASVAESFCCGIGIVSVQQVTAANFRVPGWLIRFSQFFHTFSFSHRQIHQNCTTKSWCFSWLNDTSNFNKTSLKPLVSCIIFPSKSHIPTSLQISLAWWHPRKLCHFVSSKKSQKGQLLVQGTFLRAKSALLGRHPLTILYIRSFTFWSIFSFH